MQTVAVMHIIGYKQIFFLQNYEWSLTANLPSKSFQPLTSASKYEEF